MEIKITIIRRLEYWRQGPNVNSTLLPLLLPGGMTFMVLMPNHAPSCIFSCIHCIYFMLSCLATPLPYLGFPRIQIAHYVEKI